MLFIHKAEIKKPLTCVSKWADALLFTALLDKLQGWAKIQIY